LLRVDPTGNFSWSALASAARQAYSGYKTVQKWVGRAADVRDTIQTVHDDWSGAKTSAANRTTGSRVQSSRSAHIAGPTSQAVAGYKRVASDLQSLGDGSAGCAVDAYMNGFNVVGDSATRGSEFASTAIYTTPTPNVWKMGTSGVRFFSGIFSGANSIKKAYAAC
jgi:hypothetical protein